MEDTKVIEKHFEKIFLSGKDIDDILGQEYAKKQVKSALISGRHILIIGPPGVGKTTLAKNIAKLLPELEVNDCGFNCLPEMPICPRCKAGKVTRKKKVKGEERFIRIQGSPDLTAEDLIGDIDPIKAMKYGPLSIQAFTPGKIFKANNGVLFFDELNRAPERLQNALLQVLEEGYATIASYNVDIPARFIFIATMNPEDVAAERLSDVLLDRFDIVYMTYPESIEIEKEIVLSKGKKFNVNFPDKLLRLVISFIRYLRDSENLEKKPSVRASLGLYERAEANALLRKAREVNFNDVLDAVISVLASRIRLKPSFEFLTTEEEFLKQEFEKFVKTEFPELSKEGDFL